MRKSRLFLFSSLFFLCFLGWVNSSSALIPSTPSDFRLKEFTGPAAAEALYRRAAGDFNVTFDHSEMIVKLNLILRVANLYDLWQAEVTKEKKEKSEKTKAEPVKVEKAKAPLSPVAAEMEKLAKETDQWRKSRFYSLDETNQEKITRLNRLVLQTAYPDLCPKVK